MRWSDGLVIALDTETTGLDAWNGRIIQCAATVWRGHGPQEPPTPVAGGDWCRDCGSDGVPIEPGARAANGISDERIAGCSPFDRCLPDLLAFLQPFLARDHVFAAYNAPFDLAFLAAAAARCACHLPIDPRQVLDPLAWARKAWARQSCRLANVALRLGMPCEHAHDALADAQATVRILFAIARRWTVESDLDKFLAQQELCITMWNRATGHNYRDQLEEVERRVAASTATNS